MFKKYKRVSTDNQDYSTTLSFAFNFREKIPFNFIVACTVHLSSHISEVDILKSGWYPFIQMNAQYLQIQRNVHNVA